MEITILPSKHPVPLSFRWLALLFPVGFALFMPATAIEAQCPQMCDLNLENTAVGYFALSNNTGFSNTAIGFGVLDLNTTGSDNTGSGFGALNFTTTGGRNTAIGRDALFRNSTGSENIGVGAGAGYRLTTGSNNINIGNPGAASESNKIRIGTNAVHSDTFIAGISGVPVADGVGVVIDTRGHLGTLVSSERFKDEIKPMEKASEAILALKPVTFRYKHDLDPDGIPQFGLVAEEVEKVNPTLVARDKQGKAYTVRYEAVNAMLLNEFLKEHSKVQSLERAMAEQQKENATIRTMLKQQAEEIQQVKDKSN